VARFLTSLRTERGDWQAAAAAYHSRTPGFAEPYLARVLAAWAEEQARPHPSVALATARVPPPSGGGGAMLSNRAERAVTLPGGQAGRGLDAYRSAPVAMVARAPAFTARLAAR
jgi:hypothetical protein